MKKLLIAALAVLMVGCTPATKLPDSSADAAKVVFATDLHYLSQELTDNGEVFELRMRNGDGKVLRYIDQITDAFVDDMIALQPDAVVLGGDLTLDGEALGHRDLAVKLERLHSSGVPVLVLPGNHDVNNYMASGFVGAERYSAETIDRKGFRKAYEGLGSKAAITRDSHSLSYIYPVRSDMWLLLLDVNENDSFGSVTEETYTWMEKWLAQAQEQGITVVGFTHQNILQHNPYFSGGYVINDSDRLIKLFEQYGVRLNMSGHIHLQHIEQQGNFTEVVTTAMAVTPSRYSVLDYDGSTITYSQQSVDVEGWAARSGVTDPNLLSFADYTRRLFGEIANAQSVSSLSDWGIDHKHVLAMAEYYADINTAYFEGAPMPRSRDDAAFALWERYEKDEFRYQYITSMLDSGTTNHLELQIKTK